MTLGENENLQLESKYNRYFYSVDEQGSTVFITDKNQSVRNEYYYDAFGNVLSSKEEIHNRITYTGQQFDGITKQYYLRARFYNPVVGRFTQEDIYRSDGLNLYAYCKSNPVGYYDSSGYVCESKGRAVADGTQGVNKAESLLGKVDFTKLDSNGVKDLMNNVSKSGLSAEDKILANIEIYNKALEQGIKVDSQVIASPKFIDSLGWIKWPEQSGYTIDAIKGKAIKYEVVPQNGNIIDRYGTTNGTFTSPVIDNMSIPYEQRALPYFDNKNAYHQYEVTRNFNELSKAIKNCKDKDLVELINADALRYGIDLDNLKTYGGEIAPAFEAIGGGTQWQLPLSVEYLKKLGFVKEIK